MASFQHGSIDLAHLGNNYFLKQTIKTYRHVTQTLPPVTDLFGQFLNVCCIFSGETAKDF